MINLGLRVLCEASPGQSIESFAEELSKIKEITPYDVIGVFNDVYLMISDTTKKEEIVEMYFKEDD